MKYLHTMVRISDLDTIARLLLQQARHEGSEAHGEPARALHALLPRRPGDEDAQCELTYNWDPEAYGEGRNFGHLAFEVDDIYATCERLMQNGVTINRPPRDGHMAFIRSPDNISIELLQKGKPLPKQEPWASMQNVGKW